MRDIVDLKVTQIQLHPIDVLPLSALLIQKNLAPFRDILRFKTVAPPEEKSGVTGLNLLGGEIEHEGRTYLVERLIIEPQRLTFSVFGSSAVAKTLYVEIRKILAAADPTGSFPKTEPPLTAEETSCVVTLEVDFRKLFSPTLLRFLDKSVRPRTSSKLATSSVIPFKFAARVSYKLLGEALRDSGFQLADKSMTIEPRVRTGLEERRYFTLSPTDSDTHLALLQEFEKAFARPRK